MQSSQQQIEKIQSDKYTKVEKAIEYEATEIKKNDQPFAK